MNILVGDMGVDYDKEEKDFLAELEAGKFNPGGSFWQ